MQSYPNEPQGQIQAPSNPFSTAEGQAMLLKQNLMQAYNAVGGNFYSIAVFSIINTVIGFFKGGLYFPVGLGITQIIDAFSTLFQEELPESRTVFFGIGIVLDLIIVGIVAVFGYFIKKQIKWLIVLGGVLYLLDGLLFLIFQDWVGAAFHAYFLFQIWRNWQIIQKLTQSITPVSAIETI